MNKQILYFIPILLFTTILLAADFELEEYPEINQEPTSTNTENFDKIMAVLTISVASIVIQAIMCQNKKQWFADGAIIPNN